MVEIIAQVLGYIAVALGLLSFQFAKGKSFFLFQTLLMLLFSMQFFLLGGYSGAAMNFIGMLNTVVYYFKSENKKFAQGPVWLVVFFVLYAAAGAVSIILSDNWLEILPPIAAIFNMFTRYTGNLRTIRLAQIFVSSPFWFIYDFLVGSYGGCINEVLGFISALSAFIRYAIKAKKIVMRSIAKINLVLSVYRKREDGYHDISSVFQTVSLCDKITVSKAKGITVRSDNAPSGKDNICYKAALLFGSYGGCDIKIKKRIPMSAGLGGGSSNAACVLLALNHLYGYPFTKEELLKKALTLGADVPFFIEGKTARAEGVGEELCEVSPLKCALVIVRHGEKESTGAMYKKLDGIGLCDKREEVSAFIKLLEEGNVKNIGSALFNDFENACDVSDIKNELISCGAVGACLSGSGPSVFGIFENYSDAKRCEKKLKAKYDNVFACKTESNIISFE